MGIIQIVKTNKKIPVSIKRNLQCHGTLSARVEVCLWQGNHISVEEKMTRAMRFVMTMSR